MSSLFDENPWAYWAFATIDIVAVAFACLALLVITPGPVLLRLGAVVGLVLLGGAVLFAIRPTGEDDRDGPASDGRS